MKKQTRIRIVTLVTLLLVLFLYASLTVYAQGEDPPPTEPEVSAPPSPTPAPKVVINEIDVGNYDRVELYNYGSFSVNLTGWEFTALYDGLGPSTTWTLPSFTLPAGAYVVLDERAGTDTANHLYFDEAVLWTPNVNGAGQLVNGGGTGYDFVRWDSGTDSPPSGTSWYTPNPPGATIVSGPQLARVPNGYDTDHGEDWCLQNRSLGAENTGCSSGDLIGMYSPSQRTWYHKQSNNDGWANVDTVRFGSADTSWVTVEGDWNGDGTDTIGMYSPPQKTWYLKDANDDGWSNVTTVRFGSTDTSWVPVVGNWDGIGGDTIGMYRPDQKSWYLKFLNNDGWASLATVRFGSADTSWVPVTGDWNGWDDDTIGMYSPSQKTWYLKNINEDGWDDVITIRFGSSDTSWDVEVGDW
jgi:hypothetical protein